MKKTIFLSSFILILFSASGNDYPNESLFPGFSIGFDGLRTSFQDNKYSAVIHHGFGAASRISYRNCFKELHWGSELKFQYSKETASTHESANYRVLGFGLRTYLEKEIIQGKRNSVDIALLLDLFDYYSRYDQELGNNSLNFISAQFFQIRTSYTRVMSNQRNFQFGVNLLIFSLKKEITGFATNFPQNAAENGEYSYQDESHLRVLSLKGYYPRFLNKHFGLETDLSYQLSHNIFLCYRWNFQASYEVPNYPLYRGQSSIGITYRF